MKLLSTFFRGIAVQYQMALDASSDGNFNTRNPEEAVRVVENLASINITKNTDFERKRSASIHGNSQMDEVRAKLDNVHKLLRKQTCLVKDAEAVDTEGKAEVAEDVNIIGGTGFQRSGKQNGNFYGHRSNFNQSFAAAETLQQQLQQQHELWKLILPEAATTYFRIARLRRCSIRFLRDSRA